MSTLYARAATLIRTRGWYQGDYDDEEQPAPKGCLCLIGALCEAATGNPRVLPDVGSNGPELWEALVAVARQVHGDTDMPVASIGEWNDAADRTEADVLRVLDTLDRRAAA